MLPSLLAAAVSLSWTAPPGCPPRSVVERAVGGSASTRDLSVVADVTALDGGGYRLRFTSVLDGVTSERALDAPTCGELADAVAVFVALASDVDARTKAREREEEAPPEEAARPEEERPVTLTVAEPAAAEPAPAARAVVGTHRRPGTFDLAVGTSGTASTGAFGAAYGVAASLAGLAGSERVALDVAWFPRSVVGGANASGRFSLVTAGLTGCHSLFRYREAFALASCGGAELGRVGAEGRGLLVTTGRATSSLWAALRAGAAVTQRLSSRFVLRGDAWAVLPLVRDRFVVDEVGAVHLPEIVSLRVALGVEASIP